MKRAILIIACNISLLQSQPIAWKQYFTLAPDEGLEFIVDSAAMVPGGGVPVLNITRAGAMMLTSAGGAQLKAFELTQDGRILRQTTIAQRGPDGGFVYLPDGRARFLGEEPDPTRTAQRHKSRIVSWVSNDGQNWIRESGIRYQPGAEDDSISSVASVIQVKDSTWRMYYVGDFYRTNGTRTALSFDWGMTWQQESKVNVVGFGNVDPHPVYLSNGKIRLYFRMGMNRPPDKAGVGYCDSDDGLHFDTLKATLLISDAAVPAMFKLDPAVMKLPNGQVVCYIGAAPSFGQTVAPKLIAAWGRKQAVSVEKIEVEARQFELFQNYPNPFNGTTNFRFRIPDFYAKGGSTPASQAQSGRVGASGGEFVSLKVLDVLGREVATLVNEIRSAGTHVVQWDGRDESGHTLPSGVYLFSLRAGPLVTTRKAILTK